MVLGSGRRGPARSGRSSRGRSGSRGRAAPPSARRRARRRRSARTARRARTPRSARRGARPARTAARARLVVGSTLRRGRHQQSDRGQARAARHDSGRTDTPSRFDARRRIPLRLSCCSLSGTEAHGRRGGSRRRCRPKQESTRARTGAVVDRVYFAVGRAGRVVDDHVAVAREAADHEEVPVGALVRAVSLFELKATRRRGGCPP